MGYIPTARLGWSSEDASLGYWMDFVRWARTDRWLSAGGEHQQHQQHDYAKGLERVAADGRVRVLIVLSEGDRLSARPEDALLVTEPLARMRDVLLCLKGNPTSMDAESRMQSPAASQTSSSNWSFVSGYAPNHMQLTTNPKSVVVWQKIALWLQQHQQPPAALNSHL